MLMLSRRIGERIYIGENIRVTFHRHKGDKKVVIGVECPDEIQVWREEIMESIPPYFKKIDAEKQHASQM
jgi:carbon storage regulator CsrA